MALEQSLDEQYAASEQLKADNARLRQQQRDYQRLQARYDDECAAHLAAEEEIKALRAALRALEVRGSAAAAAAALF